MKFLEKVKKALVHFNTTLQYTIGHLFSPGNADLWRLLTQIGIILQKEDVRKIQSLNYSFPKNHLYIKFMNESEINIPIVCDRKMD